MTKWLLTPVILLALAAGSYGAWLYMQPPPAPDGVLYANGHVEGTEIDVSAEVSATVLAAPLEEGARVAAGDVLARLDDRAIRAQLSEAQARGRAVDAATKRVQAELATARHHQRTAERDLRRVATLAERDQASQAQLDSARNAVEEARGRVKALAAQADELVARGQAVSGQVEQLRLRLDKAIVRAPRDGTILVKALEAGELATPGRLVARLVDLRRLELKVFVAESDLGRVRVGAPARVKVSAYPERRFQARVTAVDQQAQFTPRDIHMPSERTRMVFGVTLALENPDGVLKPGMPVDAWIRWRQEAPWPATLSAPR